jgi:hypothetical protein
MTYNPHPKGFQTSPFIPDFVGFLSNRCRALRLALRFKGQEFKGCNAATVATVKISRIHTHAHARIRLLMRCSVAPLHSLLNLINKQTKQILIKSFLCNGGATLGQNSVASKCFLGLQPNFIIKYWGFIHD